jgi:hypothetical protein
MMQCPRCGVRFVIADDWQQDWQRREWNQFPYQVGPGVLAQPGATRERATPTRGQTKESDVAVPFLKSAVYGGVGASLSLIISVWGVLTKGWAWYIPPTVSVTVGLCSFSLAWFLMDADVRRTLWQIESWTGSDINQDGVVGKPQTVRVELTDRPARAMRMIDLPLPDDKLTLVARSVLHGGRQFSRRGMSGLLSEGEFAALSAAMLEGGLMCFRQADNPQSGYELTPSGRAVLRKLVGRGGAGGGGGETSTTRPEG